MSSKKKIFNIDYLVVHINNKFYFFDIFTKNYLYHQIFVYSKPGNKE